MSLANEKYVAFTTFTKAGEPKSTPVWIADVGDGKLGFTTPSGSWKARRLANDPRVRLQPSDNRGNPRPGSSPVEGTGRLVDGAHFERIKRAIKSKYGVQYTMIGLFGRLAGLLGRANTNSDAAIEVTIDE